jgi:hypothetical protein
MSVRKAFGQVVGKRISAIVVKEGPKEMWKVFLVFDDETSYELWGAGYFGTATCIDQEGIEAARRYCRDAFKIVLEVEEDDAEVPSGPDVGV